MRAVEPEGFGELRMTSLDRHADAGREHATGLHELILDIARDVDRDRERHAHVTAGAAENLRVDTDHFARHVEQRTARVAGFTATSVWMNGT